MRNDTLAERVVRRADLLGVYIHFPYCIHKCSYCDFYSVGMDRQGGGKSVSEQALREYMVALEKEFETRRIQFSEFQTINTIFFGGGTASLLPAEKIQKILGMLKEAFSFTPNVEITLEGNPENFSPQYIREIRDAGVNRIHVGVQSLRARTLIALDRYFDEKRYAALIETLTVSAIENRGADLMYGVPGQTESEFYEDLKVLIGSGVTHLSLYSLTVEHGTPYDVSVRKKTASPPDEELQARIFGDLTQFMKAHDFLHYEVSNFGKPGRLSRHNLRYWLYESTLALGPGAHGFTGKSMRYGNIRNTPGWSANPAGAKLEPHEPALEIPLCFARICMPILRADICALFTELMPGSETAVLSLLDRWVETGYATGSDSFCWSPDGIAFLNDRMIEMQETLSEFSPA